MHGLVRPVAFDAFYFRFRKPPSRQDADKSHLKEKLSS